MTVTSDKSHEIASHDTDVSAEAGVTQELGTALGYVLLLAGSLARMLQAPLLHDLQYRGSFSQLAPLQPQADAFALPRHSRAMRPKPLYPAAEPAAAAATPEL